MFELAHANTGGIPIPTGTNGNLVVIAEHGAGRDRGHAPMQTVEAKRVPQEISGALAGTADTAEFDDRFRSDIQLVASCDDLAGNGIMSAALAKRRRPALIIGFG